MAAGIEPEASHILTEEDDRISLHSGELSRNCSSRIRLVARSGLMPGKKAGAVFASTGPMGIFVNPIERATALFAVLL